MSSDASLLLRSGSFLSSPELIVYMIGRSSEISPVAITLSSEWTSILGISFRSSTEQSLTVTFMSPKRFGECYESNPLIICTRSASTNWSTLFVPLQRNTKPMSISWSEIFLASTRALTYSLKKLKGMIASSWQLKIWTNFLASDSPN